MTTRLFAFLMLLATSAVSAQDSTPFAPPRDLAAALTPGARVRVYTSGHTALRSGVLLDRSRDTLTIATEDYRGLKGPVFVIPLREARGLAVSAGYEKQLKSSTWEWFGVGFVVAAGLTIPFVLEGGSGDAFGIVALRGLAGGLLFAMSAPRPKPVERWIPVSPE